jgi:hypothetical protein
MNNCGVAMIERLALTVREFAPLPDVVDACLFLLGKAGMGMLKGPVSDQAETLKALATLAERKE